MASLGGHFGLPFAPGINLATVKQCYWGLNNHFGTIKNDLAQTFHFDLGGKTSGTNQIVCRQLVVGWQRQVWIDCKFLPGHLHISDTGLLGANSWDCVAAVLSKPLGDWVALFMTKLLTQTRDGVCNRWPFIAKGFPPDEKHLHGVGLEIKNFAPNADWDAEWVLLPSSWEAQGDWTKTERGGFHGREVGLHQLLTRMRL